jgi:hypothetical protein
MKRLVLVVIISLVLFENCLYASTSWIINRSFEYDGNIGSIGVQVPTGWEQVAIPSGFGAGVTSGWSSKQNYSLNIFSFSGIFSVDDTATISQDVFLRDVNEIVFDLKLETGFPGDQFHPQKRSAIVKIDDDVVWTSDSLGSGDLRGEYLGLTIDLNDIPDYKDANSHVLTLGLRSNVNESFPVIQYTVRWDFLRLDTHCESYGYLDSDFNHDSFVNFIDYGILANHWMEEVEDFSMIDLDPNNVIDGNDLEIFLEDWLGDSNGLEDEYIESDLNLDGIVNFVDYAMLDFSEYSDPNNLPDNIETLLEQWLWTNWMYWVKE